MGAAPYTYLGLADYVKPEGKVTIIGPYAVDHNEHIVYALGVDDCCTPCLV